jgi:two-component system, NtrC family, C4-dicarboxylate transport sensor histidine kinase DctB
MTKPAPQAFPAPNGPEVTKLAAKVAHELNNPLDAVLRFVSLAQRKAKSGDYSDLDRHLADAQFGLQRMAEILRELMDIGRQTNALLAHQNSNGTAPNLLPLADLLERARRTTAALAEQKHIHVRIDNALPANVRPRYDLRLAQIFSNLLKNALEASPDGSTIIVTLAHGPDGRLHVTVTDAGPGLSPELLPHLFTPFVTTKGEGTGHGLGLAISRELAISLGGTLTLDNGSGATPGCVATLTVPLLN